MALNGGGEGVCINPRSESSKISLEVLTHIFYFCVASLNREHRTYMRGGAKYSSDDIKLREVAKYPKY